MPREHTWKQAHSIHVHEIVGPLLKTQKTCIGVKMEGSPRNPLNTKILLQSSQAGKM